MDYRRFLTPPAQVVLPHFGGASLDAGDRRLRLAGAVAPGWWSFQVQGRLAQVMEPAEPDPGQLAKLQVVRGHLLGDRLVRQGAQALPLFFLPQEEPARFAPLKARLWPSGQLIHETVELEGEAEEQVRRRLEDGQGLSGLKAVPASLRAAFGYARVEQVGRRLQISAAPAEVRGVVLEVAERDDGAALAEAHLRKLAAERALARASRRGPLPAVGPVRAPEEDEEQEVHLVLAAAGAELLALRRLGEQLELTYRFEGERFLSLVERRTLRVVDAGICLAGHDDRVTLHSLPAVIRQAIREGRLVIARHTAADPVGRYHWERELVEVDDE